MKERKLKSVLKQSDVFFLDFERLAHMFSEKIERGFTKEMRSDDSLARTLFLCVLVNLLPVVCIVFCQRVSRFPFILLWLELLQLNACLLRFFERNGLKVTRRILLPGSFLTILLTLMSALSRVLNCSI